MEYVRKSYVCNNQIKKGISGVKEAIAYMQKNYSIALMVDQRVSEGPRIPFFGEEHTQPLYPLNYQINLNVILFQFIFQGKKMILLRWKF